MAGEQLRSCAAWLARSQRFSLALMLLSVAGRCGADAVAVHLDRAEIFSALGRYQEALQEIDAADKLDPTSAMVQFRSGCICESLNNLEGALKLFDRAVKRNCEDAEVFFRRGAVCCKMGNWGRAANDFGRYIERQENAFKRAGGLNARALAWRRSEEYQLAIEDLAAASKAAGPQAQKWLDFVLLNLEAECRLELGQLNEAIARASEAIKLQPEYTPAWRTRARAYELAGNFAEAKNDYMKLNKMPDPPEASDEAILQMLTRRAPS